MMILTVISLIFSCFIQGIVSNYLGYTYSTLSIFSTVYVLITLLVFYPYFENDKKYLILLIIFGLIVDIVYANTLIFNTCLFVVVYFFSKTFHHFFPYNFFTINLSNLLGILIYHILSFSFLYILGYDAYQISMLFKILSHSILMTVFYTSFLYGIINFIQKKLSLREVK